MTSRRVLTSQERCLDQEFSLRSFGMTCDDLRKVSNLSRSVLLESVQISGDRDTDVSRFAAALKEVDKGFIQGPIDKDDLPVGSTLTNRFPVKQKNKVRPIYVFGQFCSRPE